MLAAPPLAGGMFTLGTAALFSGAPSGISQRWPGCPCAGFSAAVVALPVAGAVCIVLGAVVVAGALKAGGGVVAVSAFLLPKPELQAVNKAAAVIAKKSCFIF